MNQSPSSRALKLVVMLISLLLMIFSIQLLNNSIKIRQNSGQLFLKSPDKNAVLSISQENHQAKIIGTGQVKVLLKPGNYEVAASSNGYVAYDQVNIASGQTTEKELAVSRPAVLQSVGNIAFIGFNRLISTGLSDAQIFMLKNEFFKFMPASQTVSVDTGSVYPESRSDSPPYFKIKFKLTIDSKSYNALITYSDINTVRLYLSDPSSGSQVFDSGP